MLDHIKGFEEYSVSSCVNRGWTKYLIKSIQYPLVTGVCLFFTHVVCAITHTGDLDEHFGFERDTPPGQNLRDWHKGYIGLPSQRKTSNCDVSVKNRPHGRDPEGAQSSFCDTEMSGSESLKG